MIPHLALGNGGGEKTEKGPIKLMRGKDPISEFDSNGLTLMLLFRHIFPLARWKQKYDYKCKVTEFVSSFSSAIELVTDPTEREEIQDLLRDWEATYNKKGTLARGDLGTLNIADVEDKLVTAIDAVSKKDGSNAEQLAVYCARIATFKTQIASLPLVAKGTLSKEDTRHLLLQHSTNAAHCSALLCVL